MANPTMTLIASSTVGSGGVSSVTFSSIPATYTDLVLKCSARTDTTNSDIGISTFQTNYLRFNNYTATNVHKSLYLYGNGSSAASGNAGPETIFRAVGAANANSTANTFANTEVYIPNYTSSNYKSVSWDMVGENNCTTSAAFLSAGLFSLTNAITEIDIFTSSGNYVAGSTFYLYGIASS